MGIRRKAKNLREMLSKREEMEICLVRFSLEQFGVLSGSILSRVLLDKIWVFWSVHFISVTYFEGFGVFLLMLNSRVIFMTVEVNVFYAYFEGFISDRSNRLINIFHLSTQNCILLQPFLMNPQNKCVEIGQVFCSVSLSTIVKD